MQPTPLSATAIIPTFNEENFIEGCIMSLIDGTSPECELEILVVDGGSSDQTIDIVERLAKQFSFIKRLDNLKKIVPCAMNIGASAAQHRYLVWCGAHAIYGSGYIEKSLQIHQDEHCSSSGGVLKPIAKTDYGRAIAIATSSKFGVGGASYRHANSRREASTVFGGCFSKESLKKVGGFNEQWVRNQDVELNYRLRTKVGPIIIDPEIKSYYYCRETLKGLYRQYYQYGFWRLRTALRFPSTFSLRLTLPVGLTLMTFLAPLLYPLSALSFFAPSIYFIINIAISTYLAIKHKSLKMSLHLPIIFSTLHYAWGIGFLTSAFSMLKDKLLSRSDVSNSKKKNGESQQ